MIKKIKVKSHNSINIPNNNLIKYCSVKFFLSCKFVNI